MQTIKALQQQFPYPGKLTWIGLRPSPKQALLCVAEVRADTRSGLLGDRYSGRSGKRQVTLLQQEHLAVIAALTGKPVTPAMLRRNLVVHGINLQALLKQPVQIGTAVLLITGHCHPCSRMENIFGPGGYNALRGHGGVTAQVITNGMMHIGDAVIKLQIS